MAFLNIFGFLFILISLGVVYVLRLIFNLFLTDEISYFISLLIVFLFALFVEILELKPRIFFFPAWIISGFLMMQQAWVIWGWYSIGSWFIIGLIGYQLLVYLGEKAAEKSIKRGNESFLKYKNNVSLTEEGRFDLLLNAFISESYAVENESIVVQDLEVLKFLLQNHSHQFNEEETETIRLFTQELLEKVTDQDFKNYVELNFNDVQRIINSHLLKL